MRARVRRYFSWSWVVTLPVTLLGGYWLYNTLDRFGTYTVRYFEDSAGAQHQLALGSIGRYEADALAQRCGSKRINIYGAIPRL